MNKLRPTLSIFLMLTTALLSSCGDNAQSSEDTSTSSETTAQSPATDRFVSDELPELNYGGKKVTILVGDYNNAYWNDFYAEESNGNRINDTLYSMKQSLNERLGIDLSFYQYTHTWSEIPQFTGDVTKLIMSDSDDYDVIVSGLNFIAQQMEGEYFTDLSENKYIDFDKPWWNSTILESMPSDSVFFATGDGTLAAIKHTLCIFFNQDQLDSVGIKDNLYELVNNGEWTLDKLDFYAKQFYNDLNGSSDADFSDNYGLTFGDANKYLGFINSLGINIAEKRDGGYEITFGSERANDAISRLTSMIHDNDYVYPALPNSDNAELISTGGGNYASKIFTEGRAAFQCGLVQDASTIVANASFKTGILPYPKWDEAQENYVSMLQRNCYFLIPTSCADEEMSGALLEAWSSLAYRQLQPEYFEVSLKARYSEDDEMAQVYDLLRESLNFDIGETFGALLGTPSGSFRAALSDNNTGWASTIASNLELWQTQLDECWESFSK